MSYGVYIHIPFCKKKCQYCDFPSWEGKEDLMSAYTQAIVKEIEAQEPFLAKAGPASSVFIGGGTPTVIPITQLERIIDAVRENIPLDPEAEFTVEANPGTVTLEHMTALYTMGVTRLSIGAQTFENDILERIGRIHTAQDIKDAVRWARAAGFTNVSMDLMYGLPGQTMKNLVDSIGSAMDLAVTHISVYGLQVEDGTPLKSKIEAGEITLPTDEETEAMYDYVVNNLPPYGFARYEISNFARDGFESRHNLGYWSDKPYIGFGAAAHSYWGGRRTENLRTPEEYIASIERGESPARPEEPSTPEIQMAEFCFLELRTVRGIDREQFEKRFGCTVESVYQKVIDDLKSKELLTSDEKYIRLTPKGMKLGNVAFRAFLL